MGATQQFAFGDVRALLRLCNRLHEIGPEPAPQKKQMLDGVRALTGADEAWASVAALDADAPSRPPALVSVVHVSPAEAAASSAPRQAGAAPWAAFRRRFNPAGTGPHEAPDGPYDGRRVIVLSGGDARRNGHHLHSFLPLSSSVTGGSVLVAACLTVCLARGRPRFTPRERSILCALHAEVGWVYRADVMLASPATRRLSPRQRETLRHLLAGRAEKQIAAEMRLSPNTIHHYVKALHKHFGVSSRSELLARWVGR